MNKILISRTDGIGDLLLTTPLFKEIKVKYPKARVCALVSGYAGDLLRNNPAVDEIIFYGKDNSAGLAGRLREEKFDAVIAVYPRPALAWDFWRAGIPLRIGTAYRWYSFLYNKRIRMHRKGSVKNEADYNLELAAGLIGDKKAKKTYYYQSPAEKNRAAKYLASKGIKGRFLIIHPGSKGSAWNLSEAQYSSLSEIILEKTGLPVLLTGGNAEKAMLLRVRDNIKSKKKLFIMEEGLALREFAAVISRSYAVISCSTGPMHIAAALGVKTLSFFPPDNIAAMRPLRWAAPGSVPEIIQPPENSRGMGSVSPETVLIKLRKLLAKK